MGLTTIDAVVAPVLQVTPPVHPVAVKVTVSPTQMLGLEAVTVGATPTVFTVIFALFEAGLSQIPTLQIAVYSVVIIGLTVIDAPVAPFDQTIVPAHVPLAVSVADSPEQIRDVLAEMVGAVGLPTVMVSAFELPLVHPPTLQIAV